MRRLIFLRAREPLHEVFAARGVSAADVAVILVERQHAPHRVGQRGVQAGQTFAHILMHRRLADAEAPGSGAYRCAG